MGLVAGEDDGDSPVVGGKIAETEELEEIIWECVDGKRSPWRRYSVSGDANCGDGDAKFWEKKTLKASHVETQIFQTAKVKL